MGEQPGRWLNPEGPFHGKDASGATLPYATQDDEKMNRNYCQSSVSLFLSAFQVDRDSVFN